VQLSVTSQLVFFFRLLSAGVMLISAIYIREIMSIPEAWLRKTIVMGGLILGFYAYTHLCIAEGERRAGRGPKPGQSDR
jgi:drug/metabolite transporter (DMT)-like permease